MSKSANDVLLGTTGAPVLKFPADTPGTMHKGVVVSSDVRQATDIDGTPKTFDNGDAKWDVVIVLKTDYRDPSIENDDGERRIIAGYEMQKAIGSAMRAAGVRTLDAGGMLALKHTHNEAATKPGRSATKKYVAQYQPPTSDTRADDLLNTSGGVDPNELI